MSSAPRPASWHSEARLVLGSGWDREGGRVPWGASDGSPGSTGVAQDAGQVPDRHWLSPWDLGVKDVEPLPRVGEHALRSRVTVLSAALVLSVT